MSEWQPARIIRVHSHAESLQNEYIGIEQHKKLMRRVVRVRQRNVGPNALRELRAMGCTAAKFYEIHPADTLPEGGNIVCEHEILTD